MPVERGDRLFFSNEPQILGYGELLLCDRGWARVRIEFSQWTIHAGETITFFPTDIVQIEDVSEEFHGIALVYSDDMLRMASLHIEESVYFSLRNDRLCRERQIVADVISPMLTILQHFFSTDGCRVTDEIVALQLKSFFWVSPISSGSILNCAIPMLTRSEPMSSLPDL